MSRTGMSRDPLRALDALDAPDRWDEIMTRAALPPAAPDASAGAQRRWVRRPALLAAAAVVLVALAGAMVTVAIVRDHDDGGRHVTANRGGGDPIHWTDPPSAIWGPLWSVVRVRVDGKDVRRPDRLLDAQTPGSLFFTGCHGGGGTVRLVGRTIEAVGDWPAAAVACYSTGADPTEPLSQTLLFSSFLRQRPTVQVSGRQLRLATADTEIRLVQHGDRPAAIWGRKWDVYRIVRNGRADVPVTATSGGQLPVLTAAHGVIILNGCNGSGGPARLDGAEIVPTSDWGATLLLCAGALNGQDLRFHQILSARPKVWVDGRELSISDGSGSRIQLREHPAQEPVGATNGRVRGLLPDGTAFVVKDSGTAGLCLTIGITNLGCDTTGPTIPANAPRTVARWGREGQHWVAYGFLPPLATGVVVVTPRGARTSSGAVFGKGQKHPTPKGDQIDVLGPSQRDFWAIPGPASIPSMKDGASGYTVRYTFPDGHEEPAPIVK
ncbi:MAG: hypothetical protein JWM05_523 [Acidimicrobiales bacterium]|nr:hypothetical protein [Acidimicrobiales bacterium]